MHLLTLEAIRSLKVEREVKGVLVHKDKVVLVKNIDDLNLNKSVENYGRDVENMRQQISEKLADHTLEHQITN